MTENANFHNKQDSQDTEQLAQEQVSVDQQLQEQVPSGQGQAPASQQQPQIEQQAQMVQPEQQAPLPPITPKAEQPQQTPVLPAEAQQSAQQPQQLGQAQQPEQQTQQQPDQQQAQQQNSNQQPQNPQWSFLRPAGQNDSAEFSALSRLGWFALGFVGGFFGMLAAWLWAGSLPAERRRRAVNTTWLGFLCQAILVLIYMLMGGAFPFAPTGTTQTTTSQSTSAFG